MRCSIKWMSASFFLLLPCLAVAEDSIEGNVQILIPDTTDWTPP